MEQLTQQTKERPKTEWETWSEEQTRRMFTPWKEPEYFNLDNLKKYQREDN